MTPKPCVQLHCPPAIDIDGISILSTLYDEHGPRRATGSFAVDVGKALADPPSVWTAAGEMAAEFAADGFDITNGTLGIHRDVLLNTSNVVTVVLEMPGVSA